MKTRETTDYGYAESSITRLKAGDLVIRIIAAVEASGLPVVYLRGYELLPTEVGNDVDLLVPQGKREQCANLIIVKAEIHGWRHLRSTYFSPLAVYLYETESGETLHIDLFDRIEWHAIEFANSRRILAHRRWNGLVHIPGESDEAYLNIMTRLLYQASIRDKHREQAAAFLSRNGARKLQQAFADHLGAMGGRLAVVLQKREWAASGRMCMASRGIAAISYGLLRPHRLVQGLCRYMMRGFGKLFRPPGYFIVFEGPEGVGKSTTINELIPWCRKWCAGRTPYSFDWMPGSGQASTLTGLLRADSTVKPLHGHITSLVLLCYHVLWFWWGWLTRIYPAKVACKAIIGELYAYDLYMDPLRFRLQIPEGICRLAAALCPLPDVVIGLIPGEEAMGLREIARSREDGTRYQRRWTELAGSHPRFKAVIADDTPDTVIRAVKRVILSTIIRHG